MKNRTYDYRIILALLLILVCLSSIVWYRWWPGHTPTTTQKQPWMTVFVHGSFGTTLGLFSVFNVIKDNVENTNYKRMTSHMRHDPFFYQLQPMLSPGLYPITPTFTPPDEDHKPVIMPFSAAYQELTEHVRPNNEGNYFYTFGWSGLMSQERRRKEALRLYNMLNKEYAKLVAQGITPKIRLISHSHGGNLLLNMAGIHDLLSTNLVAPTKKQYPDDDYRTSMNQLHKILVNTKGENEVCHLSHQKKWDYHPEKAPFSVDEIVLLGTPVQPETSGFFLSPFFKKIYHFYSDDDIIQGMDWVSTRRYYSEQRVPCLPTGHAPGPKVIQAKITLNKPTDQKQSAAAAPTGPPAKQSATTLDIGSIVSDAATSLWTSFFGQRTSKAIPDPKHKELWFMGWRNKDGIHAQNFIKPYPFAIFVPLMQHLIDEQPESNDFDIRIKFKDEAIDLMTYPHDSKDKQKKISVPRKLIKTLQDNIAPWQPANTDPSHEMNILHRYSKMLNV